MHGGLDTVEGVVHLVKKCGKFHGLLLLLLLCVWVVLCVGVAGGVGDVGVVDVADAVVVGLLLRDDGGHVHTSKRNVVINERQVRMS